MDTVDVVRYRFAFEVDDSSDEIRGRAHVLLDLLGAAPPEVRLDLASVRTETTDSGERRQVGMEVVRVLLQEPEGRERTLRWEHRDNTLTVFLEDRSLRRAHLVVHYRGRPGYGFVIGTNKFGDRTFFADHWPEGAREWLPTVDHPSDKAICGFEVTAPAHYQVVGCGRLREESDLGDGRRRTVWQSDAPMATKVMAVGIARFAVEQLGEVAGVALSSWVFPQDRSPGFYDYQRAENVLRFFVDRLGAFPYSKLANVQSRTTWGGLENASNVFYSERSVRGTRANEGLIAHEIAHQWFGDAVTETDWIHVWLSEGFATYLTQLYMEATYGRERLEQGMASARSRTIAFAKDRPDLAVVTRPRPGVAPLGPRELLNRNAYQKGAWVLHMLRSEIGDEQFWELLREFYRRYRDGNAATEDFLGLAEEISNRELSPFFRQWVETPGHPILEGDWSWRDGELAVRVQQKQQSPFVFDLEVGIKTDQGPPRVEELRLADRVVDWSTRVDEQPLNVVLDPGVLALIEVERWERRP